MTPESSAGSSTPWRRRPANASSKSVPGRGALTWGLLERAQQPGRHRNRSRPGANARGRYAGRRAGCVCTSRTCSTRTSSAFAAGGAPLRIVGNLPYNISTPLLFRLLTQRAAHLGHVLHAAEGGGGSHGGAAGNQGLRALDRHARGRRRGRSVCSMSVPAHFSRAPRSGPRSCACGPRRVPASTSGGDGVLRTLVTAAFSHRRKTLRNSLEGPAHVAGYRILRHRSAIAAGNAGAAQFGLLAAHYSRLVGYT